MLVPKREKSLEVQAIEEVAFRIESAEGRLSEIAKSLRSIDKHLEVIRDKSSDIHGWGAAEVLRGICEVIEDEIERRSR